MTKKHKFIFLLLIALSITSMFSCQKKSVQKKERTKKSDNINLPTKLRNLDEITINNIDGKNIILLLGYEFNDAATVQKIKQDLSNSFGIESKEKNGLVSLFVYPDDFGKDGRVSRFSSMIEDKNILGMIFFGAPNGTHNVISELMDKTPSRRLPYPVYSFLPQDDVLGSQYISDFVVEYAGNTEVGNGNQSDSAEIESEKAHSLRDFDASTVIINSIQTILLSIDGRGSDEKIFNTVQKILGQNHKVSQHIDPETKIASINHFTFE